MIKKLLSVLVLVFALSGSVLAQQSMSDQQVLEYVKTGMQQGKDQRQIATELARRGVTQEQAKRVKKLYEQQNGSADKDANATMQNRNRLREKTKTQEDIVSGICEELTVLNFGQVSGCGQSGREELVGQCFCQSLLRGDGHGRYGRNAEG